MENPLGDERFKAMFTNPDFQIDEESEVSPFVFVCLSEYI